MKKAKLTLTGTTEQILLIVDCLSDKNYDNMNLEILHDNTSKRKTSKRRPPIKKDKLIEMTPDATSKQKSLPTGGLEEKGWKIIRKFFLSLKNRQATRQTLSQKLATEFDNQPNDNSWILSNLMYKYKLLRVVKE